MSKNNRRGVNYYYHYRQGDIMFVEIKDQYNKALYRGRFNLKDKNSVTNFLAVIEKFSGFSIYGIIKDMAKTGEWF